MPGDAARSEFLRRITSEDPDEQMPPPSTKRTLTAAQRELLKRWIDEGAIWGKHWAYEPPVAAPLPLVAADSPLHRDRPHALRGPLDAFIIDRLRQESLGPSPEADAATLVRRLTLDLTGLPPTLDEQDDFERAAHDGSQPDAVERLVDRLLASPRFGERMVWDWLDAARYADSNGYQGDAERTMWPWRDWVIDAFNRGLPFDEFTLWQLAGDLLPNATLEQKLATGFCRNHMINGEGGRIAAENRVDYVMDMTETTATVWLGLTFNCCRCHNHKFDPLTQTDYYQLFAFFNNTPVDGGGGNPQTPPVLDAASPQQVAALEASRQQVATASQAVDEFERQKFPREPNQNSGDSAKAADLPEAIRNALKKPVGQRNRGEVDQLANHFKDPDAEYARRLSDWRGAIDRRDALARDIPKVMIMEEIAQPRETFILSKGLYNKPLDRVGIGVPASLTPQPAAPPKNRLDLARWLLSPEHPLTARVTVNRFWQSWFGVGLVKTTEDFGVQGEKPSNPELLDWLALDLIRSGWDVKRFARQTLTSGTYRQSSRVTPELVERDPENRWLARGPRHRLPAWMLRDRALAASGLLVSRVGGPAVRPYQPAGVWEEATFGNKKYQQDHGESLYRRSVYTFWRRIIAPTELFDSASRQTCTVKQVRTNTPLHALVLLNDVTYVEAARALAEQVLLAGDADDSQRLTRAFRMAIGRRPSPAELTALSAALGRYREALRADPAAAQRLLAAGESPRRAELDVVEHAAYAVIANLLLNLDEAVTKE